MQGDDAQRAEDKDGVVHIIVATNLGDVAACAEYVRLLPLKPVRPATIVTCIRCLADASRH